MILGRHAAAWFLGALFSGSLGSASVAGAPLELRFSQGDHLYAGDARFPGRGYEGGLTFKDILLHNVSIVNTGDQGLRLEKVWIEVLGAGSVMETQAVDLADVVQTAATFRAFEAIEWKGGLDVVFGAGNILKPGESISDGLDLSPRQALIVSDSYLVVKGRPDSLVVTALARDQDGNEVKARSSIEVRPDGAKNEYIFPLETDHWYVLANVDPAGHHRFTQTTEFALDATIVDSTGSPYRGEGRKWEDWYAFGKKVLAAAGGEVLRVVDGTDFPIETLSRQVEETWPAYVERIGNRQIGLFKEDGADPLQVAGGNYIMIQHANGEYTFYAHLARGSTRVKQGQIVKQGEHIAGVGGTGEIPWVHLHFQVTDGIGLMSRGLPYKFVDHVPPRDVLNTQKPMEPGMFYWLARDGFPKAR
jgi:hypothetical protein